MNENAEIDTTALPKTEDEKKATDKANTTENLSDNPILIPVKFNKEIKNLTIEEAAKLAQKGMKYDIISENYEKVRDFALRDGQNVSDFIDSLARQRRENMRKELVDKCGGNQELAEYILNLENNREKTNSGSFYEVQEQFPEIKDISQLPSQVVESAELNGTKLLDELLRYNHRCQKQAKESIKDQKKAEALSIGSQTEHLGAENPTTSEFLKGLWNQ